MQYANEYAGGGSVGVAFDVELVWKVWLIDSMAYRSGMNSAGSFGFAFAGAQ